MQISNDRRLPVRPLLRVTESLKAVPGLVLHNTPAAK